MKTPKISLITTGSGRSVSSFGWTRFALAALATAGPVSAADVTSTWTSPTSGNWNAGANWTNVPLSGGFPNNGNGGVATYDATINAVGATIP